MVKSYLVQILNGYEEFFVSIDEDDIIEYDFI